MQSRETGFGNEGNNLPRATTKLLAFPKVVYLSPSTFPVILAGLSEDPTSLREIDRSMVLSRMNPFLDRVVFRQPDFHP